MQVIRFLEDRQIRYIIPQHPEGWDSEHYHPNPAYHANLIFVAEQDGVLDLLRSVFPLSVHVFNENRLPVLISTSRFTRSNNDLSFTAEQWKQWIVDFAHL